MGKYFGIGVLICVFVKGDFLAECFEFEFDVLIFFSYFGMGYIMIINDNGVIECVRCFVKFYVFLVGVFVFLL